MIMYELHSNMPLIHIEPSASDDMRIGIESIGESGDDSSTRTVKRARTSSLRFEEITNTMPIDMSNGDIPHIEMTPNSDEGNIDDSIPTEPTPDCSVDLVSIVDNFRENISRIYEMDLRLFRRTMKQLEQNYYLLDILLKYQTKENSDESIDVDMSIGVRNDDETNKDDNDNFLENDDEDEYEIDIMESVIANQWKNVTHTHKKKVKGQSIVIAKKDQRYEPIKNNDEEFMNIFLSDSSTFSLLEKDASEYKMKQVAKSEYCLLLHVIQSEEIRQNPDWNHTIDLFTHSNSTTESILMNNTVFNRDCKEALMTIETFQKSPNDFSIQNRYLVRLETMLRLRLYQESKSNLPWFRKDINVMKICGMCKDTIIVENLPLETRFKQEISYKWLTLPRIKACFIVFGVALEKGFCPLHPKSDYCTVTDRHNQLMKVGFCLGGKERYAGYVNGEKIRYIGECSVEGCSKPAIRLNGQCKSHTLGKSRSLSPYKC